MFTNFAVLVAQWANTINSVVQSTLLPNFQNPKTGPFWNSGPNPENEQLATLNLLASSTRPVSARARKEKSRMTPEKRNLTSLLKSLCKGVQPDRARVDKCWILDGKSWFLEILEIIIDSFEDHFLELHEAPGSSSTSQISRKSSDLTSTKKDNLTSPVTHFWPHFHKFRCAGRTMDKHNEFYGAKHAPSKFPKIQIPVHSGILVQTPRMIN